MVETYFGSAIIFLFEAEGYISDDVSDYGGLTKYGISQKAYPRIDIRNLTENQARRIYYTDYWTVMHCNEFSDPLATVLFDSGVNCGTGAAGKWLQRVCNANGSQLLIDGIIGTKTSLEASKYEPCTIMSGIIAHRLNHYSSIVDKDKSQMKFFKGWINRVSSLLLHVL